MREFKKEIIKARIRKAFAGVSAMAIVATIAMAGISSAHASNTTDEVQEIRQEFDSFEQAREIYDEEFIVYCEPDTYAPQDVDDGKLVIEKIVGVVTTNKGDGEILNTDSEYNYISYKSIRDNEGNLNVPHKGDIMVTYLVWQPCGNSEDDVAFRTDYCVECTHSGEIEINN